MAKSSKSLPPWLQNAKAEGAKEGKSGKSPSKAHEKGESKRFEAAEEKAMPRKMANGGAVGMYASAKQPMMAQRAAAAGAGAAAGAQQGAQQAAMAQRAAAARPAAPASAAGSAMAGMKRGAYADGGKVAKAPNNKASMPKKEARSDPKLAGNAKGNVIHLKNGGKAKAC